MNIQQDFNGACYCITSDRTKTYYHGYQSLSLPQVISEDTQFNLASLSKMYTAIIALQLIENKQLDWNDPITKWLPLPQFSHITITHLLSHSSGIPEYIADDFTDNIMTYLQQAIPDYEPNKYWLYSNTNYVLLAFIIEKASGLSYEQCIQTYIATPLQLTHTTTQPLSKWCAHEHIYDYQHKHYKNLDEMTSQRFAGIYGDGGVYASVKEVALFLQGVLDGTYLSQSTIQLLTQPCAVATHYSYGFILQDGWMGHTGGWFGCSAQAFIHVETKEVVVLATNQEVFPAYEQAIMKQLMHLPYSIESRKQLITLPFTANDFISGHYQLEDGLSTRFTITQAQQNVTISFENQLTVELFKIAQDYYWIRNTMSYLDTKNKVFIDEGIEMSYTALD